VRQARKDGAAHRVREGAKDGLDRVLMVNHKVYLTGPPLSWSSSRIRRPNLPPAKAIVGSVPSQTCRLLPRTHRGQWRVVPGGRNTVHRLRL
jgi:hypothetical protein